MTTTHIPLEFESYYHIYNRGINRCDLFRESKDYKHFLRLYEKYIEPIADTFAWVLMPNHFHLLIRIKSEKEIGIYKNLNSDGAKTLSGFKLNQTETYQSPKDLIELVLKSQIPQNTFHIFLMLTQNILTKNTSELGLYLNTRSEENG